MLKSLQVRNFALVEQLQLSFGPGLNVITGETGAGKSILIGAIALALGERVAAETVSDGVASVEAFFTDGGRERTLKREVRPNGRSRAWVDGEAVTLTHLREEASRWVDLTAQREGTALLDPETHLRHVDRFAGLMREADRLEVMHAEWQTLAARISGVEAR
ncbi:MAG TPA: hypothetical protein ENI92_01820, partial [Bacteroidetes bacterium]|nr:hypothetical protein [Bacteroidota bacterium]